MSYTKEDLKTMQGWTLQHKVQVTQTRIMEWYIRHAGKVYVSFSGGKDSRVLLDLARRIYPDIPAAFADTGLEYPEVREFVKTIPNVTWIRPKMTFGQVIEKYGYPVISKEVAMKLYYAQRGKRWALISFDGLNSDGTPSMYKRTRYTRYKYLINAPFSISPSCFTVLKKAPFHKYEKETGEHPMVGSMACESRVRQMVYLSTGCNASEAKRPISQPMGFWTEQDVLQYLRVTGLDYPSIYGDIAYEGKNLITTGLDRTGCMFCMFTVHLEKPPNRFQIMAITHPRQHEYCINHLGCGKVLDYIGVPYRPE